MTIEKCAHKDPKAIFRALSRGRLPFMIAGGRGDGARRYSYMGADPFATIETRGEVTTLMGPGKESASHGDPFSALSSLLGDRDGLEESPHPFTSGAVGYLSYDLKEILLPSVTTPPKERTGGLDHPDALFGVYDPIIVFDHETGEAFFSSHETEGSAGRLEELKALLNAARATTDELTPARSEPRPNMTKDEYVGAVERAKDYITEGDIYQINISQRYTIDWSGDPLSLFESILEKSPAPLSAYFDCGGFQIISNSPERMLKVSRGIAETEPIKGTRPRGSSASEDSALIEELSTSEKERAEHVMIVDLERNDLGQCSVPGSVKVEGFERIVTLESLHHMVSTVSGKLKKGIDGPTCLRACFPGGSITGAPKIRAVEIIDELESAPRGIYTGALGFLDLSGEMDFTMTIRTALYSGETLLLSVGSGIVADSDPEAEYLETVLKARDFFNVLVPEPVAKSI